MIPLKAYCLFLAIGLPILFLSHISLYISYFSQSFRTTNEDLNSTLAYLNNRSAELQEKQNILAQQYQNILQVTDQHLKQKQIIRDELQKQVEKFEDFRKYELLYETGKYGIFGTKLFPEVDSNPPPQVFFETNENESLVSENKLVSYFIDWNVEKKWRWG